MSECTVNTISQATDEYLIHRGLDKKKYYVRYLGIAKWVWQDIFQKTLFVVQSSWQTLKRGEPYNYIDLPADISRLFSVSVEDECGLIQPLFYNPQLNVVSQPTSKKCGCSCDCGGACDAVNSLTVTTKLIFTINGVEYFEKKWIEVCGNGDVLEWTETPTKKYNTLLGDSGDFSDDYNNDYDIAAAPFSAYEIVTVKNQKKICKLEMAVCGCPVQSPENEELFITHCGCFVNWNSRCKKKHCKQHMSNINNNHLGETKLSECGTKVYYRPSRKWCLANRKEMPDFLLVNYQSNGQLLNQEIQIPTYALMAFWAGLDYRSKVFNGSYGIGEKKDAEYRYSDEKTQIVAFMNPISLIDMSKVQDAVIRW